MLECFPDEENQADDLWLPLHFAVSVNSNSLEVIQTLFTVNPASIKAHTNTVDKLNPCHLAAMMMNPRVDIIQRLQIYYPRCGSSLDGYSNTTLHLAAKYSNSASIV